jgi:hypothetical protein
MKKNLNIVQHDDNAIKGIGKTTHVTLADFASIVDPLNATNNANKPAASIPSMFARMLFFKTAYSNVSTLPTNTNSVYAKFVSDSLDLLEALFDHSVDIDIVKWDRVSQLAALSDNVILSQALTTQMNKFLPGIDIIYLLVDKGTGQVIGGTSPFSLVYTSPNWRNSNPTRMLVERTPKFREFMYQFAVAYGADSQLKEFVAFIQNSMFFDNMFRDSNFGGLWTKNTLQSTYPPCQLGGFPVVIDPVNELYLYSRNFQLFNSDFFIKSNLQPFDQTTTPLFLMEGVHPGMEYYEGVRGVTLRFTEQENREEERRQMPDCIHQHIYLSPIDFLEDTLLKVPYKINSERWNTGVSIDIRQGTESCFLPLKPKFFKYFNVSDVVNMLTCSSNDNDEVVKIEMRVPVRNVNGTINHTIRVVKEYAYQDIKSYPGMDPAYTIGVSPFYCSGKHYVIRQDKLATTSEVEFFEEGHDDAVEVQGIRRSDDAVSRSTYYELNTDFAYIHVKWDVGSGVLIPNYYPTRGAGINYYYGVDFGTTNTHVAYAKKGIDTAQSFGVEEFRLQVEYLSAEGKTGDNTLLTTAAREFLPNNHNGDYSFPIRTVTSENGLLAVDSKIYDHVSIGFHFSKEYALNPIYNKTLKWDFDRNPTDTSVSKRVGIFCYELLWMIKNHWMQQNDAKHNNYPEIQLTYPLAMSNWNNLCSQWEAAYAVVFGVTGAEAAGKIHKITESLAPCRKNISAGILTAAGILNIDMGGGTTDIQYYCDKGGDVCSIYNSILFAGDDLWGRGYENTGSVIGAGITSNKFTDFAASTLKDATIVIGEQHTKYDQLNFNDPKDKINCLLKDEECSFAKALSIAQSSTCRKIMYLHYASIMWHVSKWMVANGVKTLPKSISFTGLASKYLDLLFDTDERFKAFTIHLLATFSGLKPDKGINITRERQPKNITAEGAALYALDSASGISVPISKPAYHLGYESYKADEELEYAVVDTKKQEVLDSLRHFLDEFNLIGDCQHMLTPQQVIRLTNNEISNLIADASGSFDQMVNINLGKAFQVTDSLFFWALKDSLWKLRDCE